MVALLSSNVYKFKTIETGPERVTYSGWWPGEDPETSTWDIERATRAGWVPQIDPDTGKFKVNQYGKLIGNEKYLTQPEEMLWAKAATTVCKRLAPDVLLGIANTVEDLESEPDPDPVRVRSERVRAAEIGDTAATGAPKVGGKFTAWGGYIMGRHLDLDPPRRIVQEWTTTEWPTGSPPSKLEWTFVEKSGGTEVKMVHSEVPLAQVESYRRGWIDYYWVPLKKYFAARS